MTRISKGPSNTLRITERNKTDHTLSNMLEIAYKETTIGSNNTRDDSTHGHHQMVNTKIRLIIFFVAEMEKL